MSSIEELHKELTAPIKSIRVFAVETALKAVQTPELLACLKSCLKSEKDPECKLLLEHAVTQISSKLENKKDQATSLDTLVENFVTADARQQLNLINLIKITQLKNFDTDAMITKLLEAVKEPIVSAEIVKKFRKYWPQSQLKFLEEKIFSTTKSLQIASIETLIKNFPDSLKSKLVKLIFINDPVIRSLAIRGMAKHFPELAAEFIKECFEKGDHYNKVTALKICSTIRFSLIRESLLTLMFKDPEMKIFELACTILLANPDKEVTFRLIAMIPKTTSEKAEILKKFISQYCKAIEIAELCENFSTYIGYLNDYPKILAARSFVQSILTSYSQEDEESRVTLLNQLKSQLENKFVKETVLEFLGKNKNVEFNQRLQSILEPGEAIEEEAKKIPAESVVKEVEVAKTDSLLIKEFAKSRFRKDPDTIKQVKSVLEKSDSYSEAVRAAALKAAVHLELSGFSDTAKGWLKSNNEKLIVAALEYIVAFNKDDFQVLMQKFVNTELPLVRICLIRISGQEFPDYATFLAKHLLESKDPKVRRNGLEAAINIDFFPLVPVLVSFLEKEENPELIDGAIAIFLANPSIASIYNFKLLEGKNPAFFKVFETASKNLKMILAKTGIATSDEIDSFLTTKAAEVHEKAENMAKEKEYKQQLSDLKTALNWDSISGSIEELKKLNWKRNLIIFAAGFLLLNLLYYVFFSGDAEIFQGENALKPVLSVKTNYEVVVEKLIPQTNTILAKTLSEPIETLIISSPKGSSFIVKPGDKLSLIGKPYKRNVEGQIFVKVIEINKKAD